MKAYKVELVVVDFEGHGADEITHQLENMRYISPSVMAIEERDIGEWDDSHPLNHSDKAKAEYRRLFAAPQGEQPK